ncbi:hypothetical protein Q4566_16915 [Tamlana sp. 2_MG-2023]|uniref:hypothetical protein n=1 Tax=unclassified Tamlana TaxID=2614803 RepID=UPI0026E2E28C|nr:MULTISPECIES: hypothetical protein [unclassified Tamlana]MDO6761891.1 hypothetical protein [Tamlana sp. 2_MG-2023]MDO6792218.1 hypothetical protein [Tamlana sp. 1_MG-2023]
MKVKFNLLLILVLISQFTYSQKSDMSKEQKDFMYSMKFEMTKDLFRKPEYDFKSQKIDIDKKYLKSNKTKESIITSIEYFEKNAKLEIKNEGNKKIEIQSDFPDNFIPEKHGVISIEIEESKLFGNNNTQLEPSKSGSTSFGLHVFHSNQLSFNSKFDENLTGEVFYSVKFITDYSTKRVSKKDIGKTVKLNESEYQLIDIFENKIVLKPNLDEKLTINDIKVKCINLDSTDEMELVSKTDPSWITSSLIDENIYQLFKENKDLTIETYKNKYSLEVLMDKSLSGKYFILEVAAPIKNDIILYEPIYGVNKIIKVKL